MKKIYTLLFLAFTTLTFAQVFNDNLNYTDGALLTANGWTAHSGTTNFIDVGASNGLTYDGYSGTGGISGSEIGNAALLDNTGEDVNKPFAAPVTSGSLYYSFLVNVSSAVEGYFTHLGSGTSYAARVFVKPSATPNKINFGLSNSSTASYAATPTDFDLNTTYLIIVKYDVSTVGATSMWIKSAGVPSTEALAGTPEHSNSANGQATIGGVYLRQFNATQNITVDGLLVHATWFGATPCSLSLGTETVVCDNITLNTDTYNVSIPFTGGNSGTYNLTSTAGTIGGDNPSTIADGTILITNISEGTNLTVTVSGTCGFTKLVISPECKPDNTLPFQESFSYAVDSALGNSQRWTTANTGDTITITPGSLAYSTLATSGNSISFDGAGSENFTSFTPNNSETIYYSYLLNVPSMTVATNSFGGYISGLGASTSDQGATLWTKRVDDTSYNLGIEVRTGANTATVTDNTTYTSTTYQTGVTYLVVVAYTFNDAGVADDTVKLWIDPVLNAAEPSPLITDVQATTATDLTAVSKFFFRQDSSTETPALQIDELRIGTTWADVTSSTLGIQNNDIIGLNIYPNPVTNGTLFIDTKLNAEKNITIFNVLGKEVLNTTTASHAVNVSKLYAGVYIVKVIENGSTATRKLVIR
jgi:hypothetical protein